MAKLFEQKYPNLYRFVNEIGWLEIGLHPVVPCFVVAIDEGGTVYEGKESYPSMEDAFQDLEDHIKDWLEEVGL